MISYFLAREPTRSVQESSLRFLLRRVDIFQWFLNRYGNMGLTNKQN